MVETIGSLGYIAKDDEDTAHYVEMGDKVVVEDGPEIVDELCWWFVEHEGFRGWIADQNRGGRPLLSAGP